MDKNSHFKVSTERPQKLVEMIIKPYSKLKNSLHFKVQKSTAGYSSLSDIIVTAEVSSLTWLTNDAFCIQIDSRHQFLVQMPKAKVS